MRAGIFLLGAMIGAAAVMYMRDRKMIKTGLNFVLGQGLGQSFDVSGMTEKEKHQSEMDEILKDSPSSNQTH